MRLNMNHTNHHGKKIRVMYYLIVYDIASPKRLPKVLKICRKYLFWVQRSVFEGELNKSQYINMRIELGKVINKKEDSIIFYTIRNTSVVNKQIMGKELNEISCFL